MLTSCSLLLVGCSSTDRDHHDPLTSTSQAAHRSAAAKKARHAFVDPCSLLEPEDYPVVAGDERFSLPEAGLYPSAPLEFNNCAVPVKDNVSGAIAINYGYATTRKVALDDYLQIKEEYADATVEQIDGVGDEAYYATGQVAQAWVRTGDHTLYVWTMSDQFDRQEAEQLLGDMVAKAVPGMQEHQIHLPRPCPSVTSPRVVKALGGQVERGLGSNGRSGTTCTYANARRSLALAMDLESKATVRNKIHVSDGLSTTTTESQVLHRVPKSTTYLSPSEYGPYAWTYMFAPAAVISTRISSTERFGRPGSSSVSFDQAAFRTLDEWWMRTQAARLRG